LRAAIAHTMDIAASPKSGWPTGKSGTEQNRERYRESRPKGAAFLLQNKGISISTGNA